MKKLRLLCIPPYEGMYHLMNNIAAQRSDVELLVHMGNLDDGLKAVYENQNANIDAIISRGGTAETIRRHVDIPTCDIIPSVFDVLRTIRLAQGTGEEFVIVGFPSITKTASMLCDIMQYNFRIITIHSAEECEACIQQLWCEKVRTIVGDMISTSCAHQLGMQGLLIVSGVESVEAAIEHAKDLCRYHVDVRKRAGLLSDLLASEDKQFVIYSTDGQEIYSTTKELTGDIITFMRKRVSSVIAQGTIMRILQSHGTTVTLRGKKLHSNGEEYCVYTISKTDAGGLLDKHNISYLNAESDLPGYKPLEYYLGRSETATDIRNTCDRYATMKNAVLIDGARGTGKDRFAHYIYSKSNLKTSTFLIVDSEQLDENGWSFLLEHDNSPLTNTGLSIYFRRINAASPGFQKALWCYLKNSPTTSNRYFFSYSANPKYVIQEDLYLYLTETINCLRLHLPSLESRPDDIPTLIGLYINAINVNFGTRVIGFTHEAMLTLQNQKWPHNMDQLYQIIHNLVINSASSYISEEQVKDALNKEQQAMISQNESPFDRSIDFSGTLDEITRDIVQRVYQEEKLNQTRTAKRLNISRTTLWRMIK